MKKVSISILMLIGGLIGSSCFAVQYKCPAEITTKQRIKTGSRPVGWTSDTTAETSIRHWLDTMMVFDGTPSEQAVLQPEEIAGATVWEFYKEKQRAIYLSCYYTHTKVRLNLALPLDITKCTAMFSKTTPVVGLGVDCI